MWRKCADTSKESGKPSRALSRYKTRFNELFRARYRVVKLRGGKGMTRKSLIEAIIRTLSQIGERRLKIVYHFVLNLSK